LQEYGYFENKDLSLLKQEIVGATEVTQQMLHNKIDYHRMDEELDRKKRKKGQNKQQIEQVKEKVQKQHILL